MLSQQELEARYAGAVSAATACFVYADHVNDAVERLGLAGEGDLLVDMVGGIGLRVPDVRGLAAEVHERGGLMLVDNTVPSHFGCHPFELGADVVLEALDRVAAGCLVRKVVAVAFRSERVAMRMGFPSQEASADSPCDVPAPEEGKGELSAGDSSGIAGTFGGGATDTLSTRVVAVADDLASDDLAVIAEGLDSLPGRMQRHFDHARALTEYLTCCEGLESVSYPGLSAHPDHEVATRVLRHGFGPAVDFELPDAWSATAGEFIGRCRLNGRVHPAGGPHTRLHARDGAAGRAVRIFAGLDNPLMIADDLDQAMRWFRNPPEP